MSLQWHSPPQTRVAAWVQASCGIAPAPSECQSVLNANPCEMEAARTLLAMFESELWQLGIRSPAQRGIAALVRNQTGRFPSVQSVDFYLDLAHGSVESAATLLLVEDARQDERQYVESVLTHQRQQLAHMYSQPRPSALDLGRVDVATEKFLEGGGLGAEMVRTERDVAAVQDYIEQSKLHATDGRSATEPFVDPLSSTATPSAFVSGLDGNPALHEMVDAILQDSPFTSEEAPAAPALKSEASHVGATSALKKTDAGTPLCFINNDAGSKVISTEEHYEIPWFAPGTTHSVSAITGLSSPLTFETMRRDVNLHSSTPRHTRHHHFVFLGSQKAGTKDKNGNLRRGSPNLEAGEAGASPREHASSHPHMRTQLKQAPTSAGVRVRAVQARTI